MVAVVILTFTTILAMCPHEAQAQHKTKVETEDVKKYKLPPSIQDIYMVYTFQEYKKVLASEKKLKRLKEKTQELGKAINLLKVKADAHKKQLKTYGKEVKQCKDSRKRITEKWKKCDLNYQLCKAGSWKPWVITAASILVAIVGTSLAGYYGYKYKKAK
jgi:hypothetical protein